ncbi:MAG: TlpA family protein disulfide reductase [Prevotella sp.]|jgi:thiol-disulfide isomerase/thioredoxin
MSFCKIIISLSLLLASQNITAQDNIHITGKVGGIQSGNLCLIVRTGENKVDTIAKTGFTPAGFSMDASISEASAAILAVEGYGGGFPVLLSPGSKYTALLKEGDDWYIRGGALQDSFREYENHTKSIFLQMEQMQQRCDSLKRALKYSSASRCNDSIQEVRNQLKKERAAFLSSHDDIIPAYLALAEAEQKDAPYNESMKIYSALGPNAKQSLSGRILKERVDRLGLTTQGRKAPDFTLPTLEGGSFTLSKMPGKIKIIDFWASWCGPCRLNNPSLVRIYNQLHPKGLEIVSVSLDENKEKWRNAVVKDGLPWIQVSSLKGWKDELTKLYNVTGVPAIFVLDAQNNIIATNIRGEKLKAFLLEKLN